MTAPYAHQTCLPRLPVPELADTHAKLLAAIEPLVAPETLAASRHAAAGFFASEGPGPVLHKKLLDWAAEQPGSWLKPFWDALYLGYRAPLHTSSNFALLLDNQQLPAWLHSAGLVTRAAWLLQAAAAFSIRLQQESIPPENVRGTPLDMSQYAGFFGSMRLPGTPADSMYQGPLQHPLHACIALCGHIWRLDVTNSQGKPHALEDLEQAILRLLGSTPDNGPDIGLISTAGRDHASALYQQLLQTETNRRSHQQVADALFVLVIDEQATDTQQALHNLLLDGHNRWYDKPVQLVLTPGGNLGVNIEHTSIDGTTCLAILQHLLQHVPNHNTADSSPQYQRLEWELDDNLLAALQQQQQLNRHVSDSYALHIKPFTDFGTDRIKQLGFSPDAFFHMALQVAQLRTFGRMRSTYESVSMRAYRQGRTECLRPSRTTSLQLAQAMHQGDTSTQQLYTLMQQAAAAHSLDMRQAQQGLGAERHLYGLQKIQAHFGAELGVTELPALYRDPGYLCLRHDFLSTSNMSSPLVHSCAFGPVVEDGYGIFYLLLKDRLVINLSSYRRNAAQADELVRHLVQALRDMQEVVITAGGLQT